MSPEVLDWTRKKWNRLLGSSEMPERLRPVWNRLLDGPADSQSLEEVDPNYVAAVESINEWLENRTAIRSRPMGNGRTLYWIVHPNWLE